MTIAYVMVIRRCPNVTNAACEIAANVLVVVISDAVSRKRK
jgi:hypothetical protein